MDRRKEHSVRTQGLSSYLEQLSREGQLLTINQRISPELEASEIAHRLLPLGQPILFTNCGTEIPLAMNLYSSRALMLRTLYTDGYDRLEGEVANSLKSLMQLAQGKRWDWQRWRETLRLIALFKHSMPRKCNRRGACQEVVHTDSADLGILPIVKSWPHDAGAFVTLPMVITKDPDNGAYNVGMYRMQKVNGRTTGMHWHIHKTGATHFRKYKARGEKMPVAVALGGDPLLAYCATAPLPEGVSEWMLAGFLRQKSVRLVKCITQSLYVPAEADIMLEGFIDPEEHPFLEGPFGDHTGFYSLADFYPLFHITAITHRHNAVYPATIVGVPPMEDAHIAEATERLFLPLLRDSLAPEIKDWWLPPEGVAHNLAIASISTVYPGQGERLASLLWSAGQMMFTKYVVLVDAETNPHDPAQVLCAIAQNAHTASRYVFTKGPMDALDHSAAELGVGGKLLINALGKVTKERLKWEPLRGKLPGSTLFVGNTLLMAIVATPTFEEIQWEELLRGLKREYKCAPRFTIAVDANAPWADPSRIAWCALGNTDPGRDIQLLLNEKQGAAQLRIDARMKIKPTDATERWPNVVLSSRETQTRIDTLWPELGLNHYIPSPSASLMDFQFGEGAEAK